jgi:hypothetical protein
VQEEVGNQIGQDTNPGMSTNSLAFANIVTPMTSGNFANSAQFLKSPDFAVTISTSAQEVPGNISVTSMSSADTKRVQVDEQIGGQGRPKPVNQAGANNQWQNKQQAHRLD